MAPDMNSGWGIRTLSSEHPAYNPYSYQNGSVWPHDNSLIALGFKRYGFSAEAGQIARDISDAASHFLLNQLPELYAGVARNGASFPVQYLGANVPQAWAAGSCFALLQAMLGIQPDAPNDRLYVDPGPAGLAAGRHPAGSTAGPPPPGHSLPSRRRTNGVGGAARGCQRRLPPQLGGGPHRHDDRLTGRRFPSCRRRSYSGCSHVRSTPGLVARSSTAGRS